MRQITDEYRIDPFKSISTAPIAEPELNQKQALVHKRWQRNTFLSQAYKYCASNTSYNLSSATVSSDEQSNFKNCLKTYQASFKLYLKEK